MHASQRQARGKNKHKWGQGGGGPAQGSLAGAPVGAATPCAARNVGHAWVPRPSRYVLRADVSGLLALGPVQEHLEDVPTPAPQAMDMGLRERGGEAPVQPHAEAETRMESSRKEGLRADQQDAAGLCRGARHRGQQAVTRR